jgi:Helix-turn-helix domain
MDEDIRDAERRAASGDPDAEARLRRLRSRAEGSPRWRAWVRRLSEASQKIPHDIDAVFKFWNILNDPQGPPHVKVPLQGDFKELFSQILKSNWLESGILKLYENTIKDEWWHFRSGTGVCGYDFSIKDHTTIYLNLGIESDEDRDAVENLLEEIDQRLSTVEYDLAAITDETFSSDSWDVDCDIEVIQDEDEDEDDEVQIEGSGAWTHQIEAYHMFHVLSEHNKYATKKIIKQYIELFSSPERHRRNPYTAKERQKVIDLCQNNELSYRAIALETGISRETVSRWCSEERYVRKKGRTKTPQRLRQIVFNLFQNTNLNFSQIARIVELPRTTVRDIIKFQEP